MQFQIIIEGRRKTQRLTLTLPQSWEEFRAQGYDARRAIELLTSKPLVAAQTAILFDILAAQGVSRSILNALEPLSIAQILAQCQFLKPTMSATAHVSTFEHRGVVYHFPSPQFANGTALEYALADDFFKKIGDSTETADMYLRLLTATLCREDANNEAEAIQKGDKRVPLISRPEAEYRAEIFADLDPVMITVAFLYFAGVKKYINDTYGSHLFESENEENEDAEIEQEDENQEESDNAEPLGWWGVFMELAQSPTNLDKIHNMNFHTLCLWLVRQKLVNERMRQHLRGANKKEEDD